MADDNEPLASSTGSPNENTAIDHFILTMRALREEADHGRPLTFRQLSQRTHFPAATLNKMLSSRKLPTWPLAETYITACGGNPDDFRDMWERARLEASSSRVDPPRLPTVAGFTIPDAREEGSSREDSSLPFRLLTYGITSARPVGLAVSVGVLLVGLTATVFASIIVHPLSLAPAVIVTLLVGLSAAFSGSLAALRAARVQTSEEGNPESFRAETDNAEAWSFSVERLAGQYWVQLPTELFPRGPSRLIALLGALGFLGGATASIIAALRGQGLVPWPAIICALGTVATGVGLWMLRERSLVLSAVRSLGDALSGVARVNDGVQLPTDAQLDRIASSQAFALRRSRDDAAADSLIALASWQPVG